MKTILTPNQKYNQNQYAVRDAIGFEVGGLYNPNIANHIVNAPMAISVNYEEHVDKFVIRHFGEELLVRFGQELRKLAIEHSGNNPEMVEDIVFTAAHHYVALSGTDVMHDRNTLRVLKLIVNN